MQEYCLNFFKFISLLRVCDAATVLDAQTNPPNIRINFLRWERTFRLFGRRVHVFTISILNHLSDG